MDKTKLEKDLEMSEERNTFALKDVVIIILCVIIIVEALFILKMRKTISTQEIKIHTLQERINTIKNGSDGLETGNEEDMR